MLLESRKSQIMAHSTPFRKCSIMLTEHHFATHYAKWVGFKPVRWIQILEIRRKRKFYRTWPEWWWRCFPHSLDGCQQLTLTRQRWMIRQPPSPSTKALVPSSTHLFLGLLSVKLIFQTECKSSWWFRTYGATGHKTRHFLVRVQSCE